MFLKNLFRSSTNSDKIKVLSATEFQAAIQKKGVQLIDDEHQMSMLLVILKEQKI